MEFELYKINYNQKNNHYKMNVLFFDVGQADSQLIIYKDQTMLIDAGNVSDGKEITKAIKSLGINQIDYVIGTHVHEDHIGGMSDIIDEFEIGTTKSLCLIHEFLFSDIYDFAGKIRDVNIAKGNFRFASSIYFAITS